MHTVEELTCLATWKDGNAHYIVGTLSHSRAVSNEERFRCFVYEKINANSKHGKQICNCLLYLGHQRKRAQRRELTTSFAL